jgi:microcin C transport system permease protein
MKMSFFESKILKNDLQRRRWRLFKKQKRSVVGLVVLALLVVLSFTAEIWSNSRPVVMKYQGSIWVPVAREIHPSELGIQDSVVVNYRELKFTDGDWAVWPLNPWDPLESNLNVDSYPSKPSSANWFGTDDRGRDIFARLLYGFRYSITFAVVVWVLTVLGAVVIGGAMGYFGGRVDLVGQRLVEILSTVPVFFLLIILVAIFEPTLSLLVLITSLFSWIGLSYYVRGEFLKNRKMDFVESARSLGAGHIRLIFKHVLPNSLVPVITFSPFILAGDVLRLASLDYLGFGLRPPTPSWGELLNQAQKHFTTAWWLSVYPGLALFFALVLLSMVGEGVRTAMDPRKS